MIGKVSPLLFLSSALLANTAQADVVISGKPTQNMSCSGGICTPTASKAVLNVSDLANMLTGGDVTVNTGGSLAQNIELSAALSWTSTSRLALDAFQSITVKKPLTVAGTGALTVTTNDGGSNGDLLFVDKGHVTFWDLSSGLIVNGSSYTLVKSLKDLKKAIKADVNGFFALAADYNAKKDGTYVGPPLPVLRSTQVFEGLGNTISNLSVVESADNPRLGLFSGNKGLIRDLAVANVSLGPGDTAGAIAGDNHGMIANSWATGVINAYIAGGLVGVNLGTISHSFAAVAVNPTYDGASLAGGLAGQNLSLIESSFATGSVSDGEDAGGLVGLNSGVVSNSYATGPASGVNVGGLLGENAGTAVGNAYSTGAVGADGESRGGLVGLDDTQTFADSYWDLDTSGVDDPGQGAGNVANDPGITGLTDTQLKSGLPEGFDPRIWAQDPKRNNGYPYLKANPPPN